MQHPDEGMIHSWLDGALSAEEFASVESHVAGCQQCAKAVAEARGFIAASSRILTALDDVPREVIPVVPARKRDLRVFLRAAAILVVAGGSFIVLRDGGQDKAAIISTTDSAASLESATTAATANTAMADGRGAAASANVPGQQSEVAAPGLRRTAPTTTSAELSKAAVGKTPITERDFSQKAEGRTGGAVVGGTGPTVAADMAAPVGGTLTGVSGLAARVEADPLKVLNVERVIGGRRTTYQIAPTQTVTLTESEPVALQGIVTTGAPSQTARESRAMTPMSAQAAAVPPPAPPVPDSVRRPVPSAALQPNTISWTEAATGKRLTLSGNLPVERLQQIRLSIERERAAARARAP